MGEWFKACGIPWVGVKRLGSYRYTRMAKLDGCVVSSDRRVYDTRAPGGGWRVLNKPSNRRKRHKAAVHAKFLSRSRS